jgi:hypothetical protein
MGYELMGENFFSVVFYSFYIFEGNYIEFKKTIEAYVEAANSDHFLFSDNQVDLHVNGGREIGRLIHNYAAAWLSLVDHTRRIHRRLAKHSEENIRDFSGEYEVRLITYLRDTFENIFVKDLRNYVQHKEVPVPTLHLNLVQVESGSSSLQGVSRSN